MRRIKLLGLALMAIFAFGVVVAASALAEEKEPAGILYLSGESGAVTIKGEGKEVAILTIGLLKVEIKCKTVKFTSTVGGGAGEETHATLGTAEIDYTGCTLGAAVKCASENIKGEKDPEGTILQVKEDTDLHLVSLLDKENKLLAGILVGLLELVEGAKKLDLTLNCNGVKALVLGVALLDVKGVSATKDVETIELAATELPCDTNDTLCILEQKNWGATALLLNPTTKKDELMVCEGGLATFIKTAEECTKLIIKEPIKAEISKMVLIDF